MATEKAKQELNASYTKQELEIIAEFHKRWETDIPQFALDMFGVELTPKQIEIVNAFRDSKKITIRGGAGFGKTFSMAVCVWWSLITFDQIQVSIFGPSDGQMKQGLWNEVQSMHYKIPHAFRLYRDNFEITATRAARITNPADCFAEYRTASKDKPDNARGIHQTNNFVIVDEATGVDREIFTGALLNIMSDKNPKLCLVSNPNRIDSYFYDTFYHEHISQGWVQVHGTMRDGPFMTDEAYAEAISSYGGPTTTPYRIMALGEFPLSDEESLIDREAVVDAIENKDAIPAHKAPITWGLDPAGQGKDRTVLMQRHDNVATIIKEWKKLDTIQIAESVLAEFNRLPIHLRPSKICVDVIGLGNGVADAMQRYGLPVSRVTVSNKPTRKVHLYTKLRDQLWFECSEWFTSGNVSIPNHPDLIKELLAPVYTDFPKIKIESKKEMKKRLGVSPDYADALCLTFFHGAKGAAIFSNKITYTDLHTYE